MKIFGPILIFFVLSACTSQHPFSYEVGRQEAARQRESYSRWLAERPRKFDMMSVPTADLSEEARKAGFHEGSVDSQVVMLSTIQNEEGAEGLVFGNPSPAELEGLRSSGFILESTDSSDIFRFRLRAKKE